MRGGAPNPFSVGVLEEVGKLLAVFLITWRLPGRRYPWILNGMLFGAAVGAGFAAFESAGYALNSMLSSGRIDVDSSINVIFLRGALAPFGHVVWTALVAGALWRVKRDQLLAPRMLLDLRVLRILGLVIALHVLWDLSVQLPFLLKYAVLGIVAWVVVLGMITSGLKQIKATQLSAAAGGPALPMPTGVQPRIPGTPT
jgi:RsiW-degrading membrane proteinase PrsW (M82 family)